MALPLPPTPLGKGETGRILGDLGETGGDRGRPGATGLGWAGLGWAPFGKLWEWILELLEGAGPGWLRGKGGEDPSICDNPVEDGDMIPSRM